MRRSALSTEQKLACSSGTVAERRAELTIAYCATDVFCSDDDVDLERNMPADPQTRKVLMTINNPSDHGWSHEKLWEGIETFRYRYACMADEVGEEGTPHTHCYVHFHSPVRASRLRKVFPRVHFDFARGTDAQNKAYVTKTGKWELDDKSETRVEGTFEERGELPEAKPDRTSPYIELQKLVLDGYSNQEIIRIMPQYTFQTKKIDELRQQLINDKYTSENRDITCIYLHGDTGLYKTGSILEAYGAKNVCRITTYRDGKVYWDAYNGQPVAVLEDFNSSAPIGDMLAWMDRYPVMLPARYFDRVAAFSILFITSNIPLKNQYVNIQVLKPTIWDAFIRRIKYDIEYFASGEIVITQLPIERNDADGNIVC